MTSMLFAISSGVVISGSHDYFGVKMLKCSVAVIKLLTRSVIAISTPCTNTNVFRALKTIKICDEVFGLNGNTLEPEV